MPEVVLVAVALEEQSRNRLCSVLLPLAKRVVELPDDIAAGEVFGASSETANGVTLCLRNFEQATTNITDNPGEKNAGWGIDQGRYSIGTVEKDPST